MQTLLELIKYTKEKKKYQLSKLEESFYLDPQIEYKEFLDGTLKSKSAIDIDIEYESSWYLWNYIRDYLEVNKINLDFIANSTKKACLSNFLNYVIGLKATAYDSAILLRNATMNLGQMLFLGWDEKCIKYG